MRHRSEMRRNQRYQLILQQSSQDPRVRKRDLITFLSRPVTRLPRLNLLLETAKKCTAPDHPDQETLPLILGLLSEFIKSTQPGIEAAESKDKKFVKRKTVLKKIVANITMGNDSASPVVLSAASDNSVDTHSVTTVHRCRPVPWYPAARNQEELVYRII